MANEGFNTFVLGQTAATSAAATDSVPLIQGGGTKKAPVSTITSYNVVGPTGGDDTAMLNNALATAASRPVMLSFGTYIVSGRLTMPDGGVMVGAAEVNVNDYWHTGIRPRVFLQTTTGTFANGDSVIDMGNYSRIENFSIFGLRDVTGAPSVDGVRVNNVAFPIVKGIYIDLCNNGINTFSDGNFNHGSPWGNNSIGAVFRECYSAYSGQFGFLAWAANGGFCSDQEITDCWFASNNGTSVFVGSGWGNARIVNCRIEDQGAGLIIQNTGQIMIANCLFDRNGTPIAINNSSSISVTGCISASAGNTGSGSGGTGTHVVFGPNNVASGGNCDNIQLVGNVYNIGAAATSYCYGVAPRVTVSNSAILESGAGNTAVYQDTYSSSVLTPFRVSLP